MKINFDKYADGLVPTIIQDAKTAKVLMLGFMNRRALKLTEQRGDVTFFSRKRKKLWTKGETSGNFLKVKKILFDCDDDTILIKANPKGPVCHKGSDTCFKEINQSDNFLLELEKVVKRRKVKPSKSSNTSKLFERGINQIAKKVGEEAVELVIEALSNDDKLFKAEAADLLYHFMVLLAERGVKLEDIYEELRRRRKHSP